MSAVRIILPPRLLPVRNLLVQSSEDEESRAVLDDWIAEQTWNVAHDLWMLTKPSAFQQRVTVIAMGRGTTLDDVAEAISAHNSMGWHSDTYNLARYALAEAHRQLGIHRHAKYVRFIDLMAQTGPRGDEVLLDEHSAPDHKLANGESVRCIHFRARCQIPGCLVYSTGTHVRSAPVPSPSNTDAGGSK